MIDGKVAFITGGASGIGAGTARRFAKEGAHVVVADVQANIDERSQQRNTEEIGIEVELPQGSPALNQGQGEAGDVADTCLFLVSDLGRHVSGVEMFVDGGASLLR